MYSENTRPSATLSITNPTGPDLGSNSGRRGGVQATELVHGLHMVVNKRYFSSVV
jgi:hypothetical protein